jgi:membrane protein DedA with SNARE-associated domain
MDTLIALIFSAFTGALCGFLYGLWWTQHQLREAMEAVDEASETLDRAKIAFRAAIETYDDTQKV